MKPRFLKRVHDGPILYSDCRKTGIHMSSTNDIWYNGCIISYKGFRECRYADRYVIYRKYINTYREECIEKNIRRL